MSSVINASISSNGIVSTADASGILKVQSNGVTTNALAWVNFNGTGGVIRASYNVSSITVSATGQFLINFTNATTDANYCVVASSSSTASNAAGGINVMTGTPWSTLTPTTSQFGIVTPISTTTATALLYNCVVVFGN